MSIVSVDLFGPFTVKGIGTKYGKVKVWGALYMCLATKAIAVWLVQGYDAASFLETHMKHVSIYGTPQLVISDHGSQLMAASRELVGWDETATATARQGTQWKFTPPGCVWQNGLAERAIQ